LNAKYTAIDALGGLKILPVRKNFFAPPYTWVGSISVGWIGLDFAEYFMSLVGLVKMYDGIIFSNIRPIETH